MKVIELLKPLGGQMILCIAGVILLCTLVHFLMASERKKAEMMCRQNYIQQALNEQMAEQKELIKNADYKMEVLSRADDNFDDLLKLMYDGEL